MTKPKICLVVAGGTIGMSKDEKTGSLTPSKTNKTILEKVPELSEIAEIESVFVTDIDSTNMTIEVWNKIAETIAERNDDYDGFVVTHGTDTMAFTASSLSFQLQNLSKPVVFTGSQLSLNDKTRSEARSNLIFAVQYAGLNIAEVGIFFGNKLLRANRAHKASQFDFDAFESYNYPLLGKSGIRPHLFPYRKKRKNRKLEVYKIENKKIALIKYYLQMEPEIIDYYIDQGYDGLVIEGVGPGNLPTNRPFAEKIQKAIKLGIPVVINSQCEIGGVELEAYEVGKQLEDVGAISAKDMTYEAAYTKLLWVLSNTSDMNNIKRLMEKNVVGELSDELMGMEI